tara:strand:- start:2865 stop:4430 length:1566 start_codon:yes stop_codon:yes gene_type:complete
MPRPCKSSEEKCVVNNERQKRWMEKGENRWKQLQARTLHRAEQGDNVSFTTLRKYELLGVLADINAKRGQDNHIKPTLLDNLESKNIAFTKQETVTSQTKSSSELHPDVSQVTYEQVRNFFYYVYHDLSEETRAELRNKLPFVTEVNGREIRRPEGTRNYAPTGWKQNFQENKFERNIKEVLCFKGQTDSDLIPCLLEKKRVQMKDSVYVPHGVNENAKTFMEYRYIINSTKNENWGYSTKKTMAISMYWWMDRYPGLYQKYPQLLEFWSRLTQVDKAFGQLAADTKAAADIKAKETGIGLQLQFQEILDFVNNSPEFNDIKTSQTKLFFNLYREVPVRDNFGRVKIIRKPTTFKIGDENAMYIPKAEGTKNAIFYLNNYKTIGSNVYGGVREYLLSQTLTTLIQDTEKVKPRNYVFLQNKYYERTPPKNFTYKGDHLASAIVKPVLKAMNVTLGPNTSGTNYLRKAVINECVEDPRCKIEDERRLAKRMLHSDETARKTYVKPTKPYDHGSTELSWQLKA